MKSILLTFSLLFTSIASALTVTNTNDDISDTGSLRYAIANTAANGTIDFDVSLNNRTILLTSELAIANNLTIDASALSKGVIINANTSDTQLRRAFSNTATTTLRNLTITRGIINAPGAGILNDGGSLTLENCSILENTTTAGAGAGIANLSGTLIMNGCTVASNYTTGLNSQGGGIYSTGSLTIDNCTISGNYTEANGSDGGGIFSSNSLIISNSTIVKNTALNANGGGILLSGNTANLTLTNTIVTGNSAPNASFTSPDIGEENSAASTATGNNLLTSTDGNSFSGNTSVTVIADPLLGPLGYYGGVTQTIHPLENSPAILSTTITHTDQRGFTLTGPQTIGAVKVGPSIIVSDETTLRTAITDATNTNGTVIYFDPSLDGETIELSSNSTELVVASTTNGLFLDASNLSDGLTIDANTTDTDRRRVMLIESSSSVALHGLTLTGGWTEDGNSNSTNGTDGGGIYVKSGGYITLSSSSVIHNIAGNGGGSSIPNSISRGAWGGNGGGIFLATNCYITMSYSTVSYNKAGDGGNRSGRGGFGGGIYLLSGNYITLSYSTISHNAAGDIGNGFFAFTGGSFFQVIGGFGGAGGGVYLNSQSYFTMLSSTVSHNVAGSGDRDRNQIGGGGGGLYLAGKGFVTTLSSSTISQNAAGEGTPGISGLGGGILITGSDANMSLRNCTISNNKADIGGGIHIRNNATASVNNSVIAGNSAGTDPEIYTSGSFAETGINILSGDPLLAPLGFYGGFTQTMHPLENSPVILNTTTTRADQRGLILTGPETIGAVKMGPTTVISDEATLRTAIADAANQPGTVIYFDPSLDGNTIDLSSNSTQLVIEETTNGLFLDASGLTDNLTIDANTTETDRRRIMLIESGASTAIHGLTLTGGWTADGTNGDSGDDGGAIYIESNSYFTLSSSSVSDSFTGTGDRGGSGGGIFLDSDSHFTMSSSAISHNTVGNGEGETRGGNGGGIYLTSGYATISSSAISHNNAGNGEISGGFGGGIYLASGYATISSSTISHNSAGDGTGLPPFFGNGGGGGGIYTVSSYIALSSSTISHNTVGNSPRGTLTPGGGILLLRGETILDHCTISNNLAVIGAGIGTISNGDIEISHCTISNNNSTRNAGGISVSIFSASINNSIIAGNSADFDPNISGPFTETGVNILSGDPLLAPLGDYGGPTQTMPPLPGSPAIDPIIGDVLTPTRRATDQRGLPFTDGLVDIGSVELQDNEEATLLTTLFNTDNDNDGIPLGLEYILGTDINNADSNNPRNLRITFDDDGNPNLNFGMNTQTLPDGITLNVQRSLTLEADTYDIIGSYDTTSDTFTTPLDNNDSFGTDSSTTEPTFLFIDDNQPEPKAFYRLEALLSE